MGFPSDFLLLLFLFLYSEKKNVNEEEGCLHGMLFTSTRSRGGEREKKLQHIGIYTLLLQILTLEHKNQ